MKKLFLTMCLTAMLSTSAIAACNGGTEYTVDGDTFCISNINLNWWSTATWCKANGMHLATIYEVCPDWDGNTGSGKCGRTFPVTTDCWIATVQSDQLAFYVTPSEGYVSFNTHYWASTYRALCAN